MNCRYHVSPKWLPRRAAGWLQCRTVLLMLVVCLPAAAAAVVSRPEHRDLAADVPELEARLAAAEQTGNPQAEVSALVPLSDALIQQGLYQQARTYLDRAYSLAAADADVETRAMVLSRLADVCLVTGDEAAARARIDEALMLLGEDGPAAVTAALLVNRGNLHTRGGQDGEALADYREAVRLARMAAATSVLANALTNISRLQLESGAAGEARHSLEDAVAAVAELPDAYEKAFLQIALGRLAHTLVPESSAERHELLLVEYRLYEQAATIAEDVGSARLASQAYGYLGELYADEGRRAEAERLLRKAVFLARAAGADELLYRWQWRTGRLQAAAGQHAVAIDTYREAVATLQRVRPQMDVGLHRQRGSFHETTGPLYYELADLLLRAPAAGSEVPPEAAGNRLREARQTVELLKAVELQDYFQDNCVTALASRTSGVDQVATDTAVLYAIPLPDRLELLLSLHGGMEQVTVPVKGEVFDAEIVRFRRHLEKRITREYLREARQLYNWLIRPLEPLLEEQRITTLVTVPQGSLTTIPFAALNDGQQYLVEKYALATTPGLALTDPGGLQKQTARALLAGLSEGVQGFSPLPNVPAELQAVQADFGGTLLENSAFSYANMTRELEALPYPVVHIASHAQFKGQSDETFLLMWEGRLDLDRLEGLIGLSEFRSQPVELLVLSACQTAVGDERAALGLAGVAVKAGARSALASLWFVNDASTTQLVSEFYRQLKQPGVTKAEALQAAQVATLKDRRYWHPGYWAPFLLIGDWL
jgi:CHAT domain-containing protein